MPIEPPDDDVLITKWLMLGGVLWDSHTQADIAAFARGNGAFRWFAIERCKDENTGGHNMNGHTPTHAIHRYIEKYRFRDGEHEWLAPLIEHVRSTTTSDRGPT